MMMPWREPSVGREVAIVREWFVREGQEKRASLRTPSFIAAGRRNRHRVAIRYC